MIIRVTKSKRKPYYKILKKYSNSFDETDVTIFIVLIRNNIHIYIFIYRMKGGGGTVNEYSGPSKLENNNSVLCSQENKIKIIWPDPRFNTAIIEDK